MKKILLILSLLISTIVIGLVMDRYSVTSIKERAEQGFVLAQFNLGVMYDEGMGVTQDFGEALKFYRKAAEQGYVDAQYNLGVMYDEGMGVKKDYIEALKWFSIVMTGGEMKNLERLEITENLVKELTSKMTGAQISEAMRRARVDTNVKGQGYVNER